jgi:hypothetical protein
MAAGNARDRREGLLPAGSLPCVWMAAGLLAYKLCDRGFDCESCPLDCALRRSGEGRLPEPCRERSRPPGEAVSRGGSPPAGRCRSRRRGRIPPR